ncbi:unnamed protein product, partial [Allacma fusca]
QVFDEFKDLTQIRGFILNSDHYLFLEYFNICFNFILQSCLQLEDFRDAKLKWVFVWYRFDHKLSRE